MLITPSSHRFIFLNETFNEPSKSCSNKNQTRFSSILNSPLTTSLHLTSMYAVWVQFWMFHRTQEKTINSTTTDVSTVSGYALKLGNCAMYSYLPCCGDGHERGQLRFWKSSYDRNHLEDGCGHHFSCSVLTHLQYLSCALVTKSVITMLLTLNWLMNFFQGE